eukprot:6189666-Pleurochrysis_carterae.AAC.4
MSSHEGNGRASTNQCYARTLGPTPAGFVGEACPRKSRALAQHRNVLCYTFRENADCVVVIVELGDGEV